MAAYHYNLSFPVKVICGFLSGYFSTIVFHQSVVTMLWSAGIIPYKPYLLDPTRPFSVPGVISIAFWGGVWGILYMFIYNKIKFPGNFWTKSFLFGGIFPPLVGLLVVAPLKGQPIGAGLAPMFLVLVFIVNGIWGAGTGFFIRVLSAYYSKS